MKRTDGLPQSPSQPSGRGRSDGHAAEAGDTLRELFVRVCAATGDGRILREAILANLDDITSPDAVEHLEAATELLDLLAAAVSESEDPNHITWPAHLWHELSNAAADLAEHLANNTPDDHCGDVQAHIDYLNAALQVPTHLTGAFRTAAEDHTPTDALTLIAGSDTRLSLPALTTDAARWNSPGLLVEIPHPGRVGF